MKEKALALTLPFGEVSITDISLVGGKNAALGEMIQSLKAVDVPVPDGFAVTAYAYNFFMEASGLKEKLHAILDGLDTHNILDLQERGRKSRELISTAAMPEKLAKEIRAAYKELSAGERGMKVAVRSSATAEDLPGASFAGQQETYLNVRGADEVIKYSQMCIASLFTDRAISYRVDKGFSHFDTSLSVGVQKMVRSDSGCSGVAFTLDTETGFPGAIVINASYGLGEMIVQGKVTPDEYMIFKDGLKRGKHAIISKTCGEKAEKMVWRAGGNKIVPTKHADRIRFALSDSDILALGSYCQKVEDHFSKKHNKFQPMDIEWAKDGETGEIFIVQARPETVHSSKPKDVFIEYKLKGDGEELSAGVPVGTKIASGKVRIIMSASEMSTFQKGEILVTDITDPDWEPIMKIAAGIVTNKGGRTSHAAIVSRELGIPCIVGTGDVTAKVATGLEVTIDCTNGVRGRILKGLVPFETIEHKLTNIPNLKTKLMVNIGSPQVAFSNYYLPVKGVGLGRLEFIIAGEIGIHPNALLNYAELAASTDHKKQKVAHEVEKRTRGWTDKSLFYVDKIAEGVAKIATAFFPNDVIIRFSDFKTNEYSTLVGGDIYEPHEENPMIGWRGASRYYDPKFKEAFKLECRAMKMVRESMGLTNVIPMIPFCRTVEEGKSVIAVMKEAGLDRDLDRALKVYVMCEIPSNVIMANQFLDVFDGMSIGSNDLTQLVLGLDRDSGIVTKIANEKHDAVKSMITTVIGTCRRRNKYIGICGQAPSDYPDFAHFLVKEGIESISLNPDTVISTIPVIEKAEKSFGGVIML